MRGRALACLLLPVLLLPGGLSGQAATVREYHAEFTTYPFSDPNPVPVVGKIYPYFRFDGFTDTSVRRTWTVVELENRWLKVSILPEIGGKIWSAIEKGTGKSFIYDNHVIKFRDIAMRGPWTSGGIEANYGIIGHTPAVATPVDYATRQNPDGSVTCTIGTLDLLTRTSWRIEITLPADKAYFTTSSSWHNGTAFAEPYYTWMNTAIPVGDDLEFIYPGNRFLGHAGETGDWPVNRANGKEISFYRNNDFGGYKSYHVFGSYTDFFGAYWHSQDFGMARYAPRDEKPGKKLWIWGLSRQGMIWEQLLTDTDGQYAEVQSGRLFNQTADASTLTPFKHRDFAPYSSDRWTEYWFPVKGTGGFVAATPYGALNVAPGARGVALALSPVQAIADTLAVYDGARRIYARLVTRAPLEAFRDTAPPVTDPAHLRVTLGGHKITWTADTTATDLSRPVVTVPGFDWSSAAGLALSAQEKLRERDFIGAERDFGAAVARDSNYLPGLTGLAGTLLRRGDVAGAIALARRALRIDTYDPEANFAWGEANWRGGREVDARDGFDIASQAPGWRSASLTALAKIDLRAGDLDRAIAEATRALDTDRFDLDAWQLRAVAHRLQRDSPAADSDLAMLVALDPLSHAARIEAAAWAGNAAAWRAVATGIRNEMPAETLLELATWYVEVGQLGTADSILAIAPPHPIVGYWRAWLHDRLGRNDVAGLLSHADSLSPRLVFPSRVESVQVLRWAMTRTTSWQPKYYLALLQWFEGDSAAARTLLAEPGNTPSFAPFYAARAELTRGTAPAASLADLQRAAALDPGQWRYARALAERALADSDFAAGARLATAAFHRFAGNSVLGILAARALLLADDVEAARTLLDTLKVLPYEGAGEAHALYREANLRAAVARLQRDDARGALSLIARAREWPERLGAGKPYDADLDVRLEDWLEVTALDRLGRRADADHVTQHLVGAGGQSHSLGDLVMAWGLRRAGRAAEGEALLRRWVAAAPADPLAQWSLASYLTPGGGIPPSAGSDVVGRVLRALTGLAPLVPHGRSDTVQ